MCYLIKCPQCNALLEVTGPTVKSVNTETKKPRKSTKKIKFYTPRNVNDSDRFLILERFLKGDFEKDKREKFAQEIGLNLHQVSSVIAWTKDTLGGKKYINKYYSRHNQS